MQVELGKLVGKEDKAKEWVEKWKKETSKDGKKLEIKSAKIQQYQLLKHSKRHLYLR